MKVLGISAFYHDSAACIVENGRLLNAVEEERFTGIKHDSVFPENAIEWCLKDAGLTLADIDTIAWYEKPELKTERVKETFNRYFFRTLGLRYKFHKRNKVEGNIKELLKEKLDWNGVIEFHEHHKSHAAFSYFTSPFNSAAIITIDGVGEHETLTISHGVKGNIYKLHSEYFPNSIGMYYSAMTAYLGFQPNEGEYKVMGLAPYGDPLKYYSKIISLFKFNVNGCIFKLNPKYFSYEYSDRIMFNSKLAELIGLPPRLTENPLTQEYKDLAAAVQKVYEVVFCRIIQKAKALTQEDNLVLGGGCAYNGVANTQAYDFFKKMWIPFSPSDSGSAIGAALISCRLDQGITYSISPYTGPEYSTQEVHSAIQKFDLPKHISYHKVKRDRLIKITAERLASGQVCGWFQGRMEFGARALGNRSILADPRSPKMQERINKVVKKREGFRPFAPSVIEGAANRYFNCTEPIPYMNQVVKAKHLGLPAVTHINGTSRIQTVNQKQNKLYHDLLAKFNSITGVPILLNTSFNFKDQTITMTPKQAIERFIDCDMDFLVIGDYLLTKNDV